MVSLNDLCDRPPAGRATATAPRPRRARRAHASPPRTCPTAGRRRCCSTRPPARCSAATCSPRSATARRIVHDADLIQPALDAEDMFGATALTADTAPDAPAARRARAPYPGAHARPRLRRRLPPGAARPRRRLRGPLHRLARAGGGELMRQELTTDTVERYIEASPEALYDLIADVTRTPERTPDIVPLRVARRRHRPRRRRPLQGDQQAGPRARTGATSPWSPSPTPAGSSPSPAPSRSPARIQWRHRFVPEGTGTRVIESYEVTKPLSRRRLVHHRHALRPEGPPGRPAGQHAPHPRPPRRAPRARHRARHQRARRHRARRPRTPSSTNSGVKSDRNDVVSHPSCGGLGATCG